MCGFALSWVPTTMRTPSKAYVTHLYPTSSPPLCCQLTHFSSLPFIHHPETNIHKVSFQSRFIDIKQKDKFKKTYLWRYRAMTKITKSEAPRRIIKNLSSLISFQEPTSPDPCLLASKTSPFTTQFLTLHILAVQNYVWLREHSGLFLTPLQTILMMSLCHSNPRPIYFRLTPSLKTQFNGYFLQDP